MKAELTQQLVRSIEAGASKRVIWDGVIDGFGLKVTPSGAKTFVYVYRFPSGRAGRVRWFTIGRFGAVTLDQARKRAKVLQGQVASGQDPVGARNADKAKAEAQRKAPKRSVEAIAREFVERYAKRRNRSWRETERILNFNVIPAWGNRQITEITRADVNALLDRVEDNSGAPMATAVLAQVRKMFNWHATRDDKFSSPVVRGMARTSAKQMARDRVLTDDEIRVMWQALDASAPPYRQLVRFLLLTAQRREEPAQAAKGEFRADVWEVPAERFKNGLPHVVPLTRAALAQLADLGPLADLGDFLFTTTGNRPFSGFSKAKARLDAEMERIMRQRGGKAVKGKEQLLKPWRVHDLRRTAKTLMLRAGVRPDVTERVLGHTIEGVEGVYDRYSYATEKRAALEALALEVAFIVADMEGEAGRILQEIAAAVSASHSESRVVALSPRKR